MRRGRAFLRAAGDSPAAADLCRRRSHQRRRRRGAARVRAAFGIPVVTTLMGIGAFDTTQPLSHAHARHAWRGLANYAVDDCDFLIAVGARFDDRVAGVPAKFAPQRHAHRASGHRPRRDQQGQAACTGAMSACWPRRCARSALTDARAASSRLQRLAGAAAASSSAPHAMNYDRDSALIQPYYVIEEINRHTRGEAIITTGVGQHQMWAAQYFDFRSAAAVADLRQHGHHGLRAAGGHRRADRASATGWSSTSTATPASA